MHHYSLEMVCQNKKKCNRLNILIIILKNCIYRISRHCPKWYKSLLWFCCPGFHHQIPQSKYLVKQDKTNNQKHTGRHAQNKTESYLMCMHVSIARKSNFNFFPLTFKVSSKSDMQNKIETFNFSFNINFYLLRQT